MARLYTSTSFRPIINDRLDPVYDEKKEAVVVGRTKKEQKREGSDGLLDIGVVCEKQASGTSFHGYRVLMDAKFPHIIFICGKRGSGKSYTLGVMAEELCRIRIGIGAVIVDPIGIYWSMKKKNASKKETAELARWGLEPKGLDNIRILSPPGLYGPAGDVSDGPFTIRPSELTSEEWCLVFGLDRFKIQGLLIGEALEKVREGYRVRKGPNEVEFIPGKGNDYGIEDIVDAVDRDKDLGSEDRGYARTTRRSVIARFKAAEKWGIFSQEGTPIEEVSVWDQVTVVDVSHPRLENQIRALIVGILAKKILQARILSSRMDEIGVSGEGAKIPVTWLMIDEAHLLIPRRGLTAASRPLIDYAKLGRKPGCALVLATQRPAATDDDILSQIDMLIGHSLGLEDDIAALLRRVPAKMPDEVAETDFIRGIPSGFGVLADQKTQQRAMLIQIRPRVTHHSGKEAMPVKQVMKTSSPQLVAGAEGQAGAEDQPEPGGKKVEIPSIWGGEASEATPEEELEIVAASEEDEAEIGAVVDQVYSPDEEGEPVDTELLNEGGPEAEGISPIVVEDTPPEEDEKPAYADEVVSPVPDAGQDYAPSVEDAEPEDSDEDEMVGLGALSEPAEADEDSDSGKGMIEKEGEEPEEEEKVEEGAFPLAPDVQATQGEEVDCFPIVLRRDSAKGLAIRGMKTGWSGRPKEYIESIELVLLPMYEFSLQSERKGRITGTKIVRGKILYDAYMKEMAANFRDFGRSKGLARLANLDDDALKILSCLLAGEIPEDCERELGMNRAEIRDVMTDLADRGILDISEDKNGLLRGSLRKDIVYPEKPEGIRGNLPSHNPLRAGRQMEQKIDEESIGRIVSSLYPEFEIESASRVYMPYYEVTYTDEHGERKERINAFTGLFEDLGNGRA